MLNQKSLTQIIINIKKRVYDKNNKHNQKQLNTLSQTNEKWRPCLVKPKKELKPKKMRLDVLMGLVSRILSYDQKMKGKNPKYWNIFFQYFIKKLIFFWRATQAFDRLESCAVSCSIRPWSLMLSSGMFFGGKKSKYWNQEFQYFDKN